MAINICHEANEAGWKLIEAIRETWNDVSVEEFAHEDERYYMINAADADTSNDIDISINSMRSILHSKTPAIMTELLEVNGIAYDLEENELMNRSYYVLVLDMQVVSIKELIYGKGNSSKYVVESSHEKISELAKRAVYVLGLDYAMVHIVRTGRRRIRLLSVDASPNIRKKDLEKLIHHLKRRYSSSTEAQKEIKLGADPEFMLMNTRNGRMVPASRFFPRDGLVGCDNIRIPSRQDRPIAELRPRPDESPYQLQENIKQALALANKMAPYRNIKWVAGSQPFGGYSIGGHIHFSSLDYCAAVLRALDNYLGVIVFLIEKRETAVKRRRRYGYLADVRLKDYGGFEYRTPGSWLVSEELAQAVLCLAKIVASDYRRLQRNLFLEPQAYRAFYGGDKEYFRSVFPLLWEDLKRSKLHEVYIEDIQIIREMIEQDLDWDESTDIRKAWKIPISNMRVFRETRAQERNVSRPPLNSANSNSARSTTRSRSNAFRTARQPLQIRNYSRNARNTVVSRQVSSRNVRIMMR